MEAQQRSFKEMKEAVVRGVAVGEEGVVGQVRRHPFATALVPRIAQLGILIQMLLRVLATPGIAGPSIDEIVSAIVVVGLAKASRALSGCSCAKVRCVFSAIAR